MTFLTVIDSSQSERSILKLLPRLPEVTPQTPEVTAQPEVTPQTIGNARATGSQTTSQTPGSDRASRSQEITVILLYCSMQ